MRHGRHPVGAGQRQALRVGDRHHRNVVEFAIKRLQIGQIEPAMQRRDMRNGLPSRHREVEVVDMEVNDIELPRHAAHALEQQDVMGELVDAVIVETQRPRRDGHERRVRDGIAAGKERHVVALPNELVGQIRDDPFGAAVVPGRYAFVQRRDLCDPHDVFRINLNAVSSFRIRVRAGMCQDACVTRHAADDRPQVAKAFHRDQGGVEH
jgi:hypothetical protein